VVWLADRRHDKSEQDEGEATAFDSPWFPDEFALPAVNPGPISRNPAPLEFPPGAVSHASSFDQPLSTAVDDPALPHSRDESSALLEWERQQDVAWNLRRDEAFEQRFAALCVHSRAGEQREDSGWGQYPDVQVRDLGGPLQSAIPQQQRQEQQPPSQVQHRVVSQPQSVSYQRQQHPITQVHQNAVHEPQSVLYEQRYHHSTQPQQAVVRQQQQQHQTQQNQQQQRQQQHSRVRVFASPLQSVLPQQQQQPQQYHPSQVQQDVDVQQPQSVDLRQQQHQFSQPQQAVLPRQQQQQQPDVYLVENTATRGQSYAVDFKHQYELGVDRLSELYKSRAIAPMRKSSIDEPASLGPETIVAMIEKWVSSIKNEDSDQVQAKVVHEAREAQSGSFDVSARSPEVSSLSQGSATPVRLSETSTGSAFGRLVRENVAIGTIDPTELKDVDALDADANTRDSTVIATPPASRTAAPIFAEAREDLKRLQADIGDLSDGSDSLETSASDSDTLFSPEQLNDHTTNNDNEETVADTGKKTGLRTDTGESTSPFGGPSTHKRSQLDDTNENHARAETAVDRKRTKLSNLRFICCFHDGPGRKCSGTDDTISEVLKNLAEQHDTHVCGQCWVLKVKDGVSGLPVHPNGSETCLDYCLSPQCHGFTPTIGYRHRFDQRICKTKTSRVRPGDAEAVYRFIFRLAHGEFDLPSSVWTTEHSLHLDAMPRQSRRKPNKEELAARANDLEKKLEEGHEQNAAYFGRICELEQKLTDAEFATRKAEQKNGDLEKQTRRIIAMLSDALRTGIFIDQAGHASLLVRVEEDAPSALSYRAQALFTPSTSDDSQRSSTTPAMGNMPDMEAQSRTSQAAASQDLALRSSMPASYDEVFDGLPSQRLTDQQMDFDWPEQFEQPGGNGFMPGA
jgi:hypothetical protein